MIVLALDPGTTHTGWALIDTAGPRVLSSGKSENEDAIWYEVAHDDPAYIWDPDLVLIEAMSPRGMRLGIETMEALRWSGRLEEAAKPTPVVRISRDMVKETLLGKANVKGADAAIRQVLIDRWAARAGRPLDGKAAAVGTKASPGPLWGIRADAWQALALWEAHADGALSVEAERARAAARRDAA
jgi:hypothetical protein